MEQYDKSINTHWKSTILKYIAHRLQETKLYWKNYVSRKIVVSVANIWLSIFGHIHVQLVIEMGVFGVEGSVSSGHPNEMPYSCSEKMSTSSAESVRQQVQDAKSLRDRYNKLKENDKSNIHIHQIGIDKNTLIIGYVIARYFPQYFHGVWFGWTQSKFMLGSWEKYLRP